MYGKEYFKNNFKLKLWLFSSHCYFMPGRTQETFMSISSWVCDHWWCTQGCFWKFSGSWSRLFFLSMALNLESMNLDSEKKNNPLRCLAKAVLLDRDPVERWLLLTTYYRTRSNFYGNSFHISHLLCWFTKIVLKKKENHWKKILPEFLPNFV